MDREEENPPFLIIPPKPIVTNNLNFETCDISLDLDISISDLQINGTKPKNDPPRPLEISEPNLVPDLTIPGDFPCLPPLLPKSPDDLIESLKHKAHPQHPLKLVFYPAFIKNQFSCAACGGDITDNYAYRCVGCKYNLHVKCAFLPESMPNDEHVNPLILYYSVDAAVGRSGAVYYCGTCWQTTPNHLWVYYCRQCDYGTDASCILVKEHLKEELQNYKDDLKTYTDRPGAKEKCTRKMYWWR